MEWWSGGIVEWWNSGICCELRVTSEDFFNFQPATRNS